MFKLFKIEGSSLFPLLKEGQVVFCLKPFFLNPIKINDFVLFTRPGTGMMIKRVHDINDKGYYVKGENAFSIDSRDFGELAKSELLYKVIFTFK